MYANLLINKLFSMNYLTNIFIYFNLFIYFGFIFPQYMDNEEVISNRILCFWYQNSTLGWSASSRDANSDPQAVVSTLAIIVLVRSMGRVVAKWFGIVQVLWQEMYKVTQCSGYLIWLLMGRWYYSVRTGPERSKVWKAWTRLNRAGDSGQNLCLILWSFSLLEIQIIFFWLAEQLSPLQ